MEKQTQLQSNNIISEKINFQNIDLIKYSEAKDVIQSYLSDESKIITGDAKDVEKVWFPTSTEEAASILKEASKLKIQVTTSGAGTGLTGSRVAKQGWVLSTEKIRTVKQKENEESITWKDEDSNIEYKVSILKSHNPPLIRVPVSMRLRTVQHLVKSLGYFYPPDTTEWSSFIGGNVATNASGARTFKYGSTRSYVEEIRTILSSGMVLELNRQQKSDESFTWKIKNCETNETIKIHVNKSFPNPKVSKNAVGFPIYENMALIELFIGTEGIFGVTTEIVLRLLPFPKNIFSLISYFKTNEQAIEFVKVAQNQKTQSKEPIPMSVEYFDYYALELVKKDNSNIPPETHSAVYLEQDVEDKKKIDDYLEFWVEKLDQVGYIDSWAELDERGIERHKEFRHSLPVGVHDVIKKNKVNKVGTDFAVPSENFPDFLILLQTTAELFKKYQIEQKKATIEDLSYVIYGHIGNDHLHLNFLPKDQEALHKAEELYLDMAKQVVQMGGTISAEHGVGKKYYGGKPYIWYMIGDSGINELKSLKLVFDPANILNRGNVIGF